METMTSTQAAAAWLNKNVTVKTGKEAVSFINNSYLSTLQKTLYSFYKTGKFCDVTVACFDISYQAHSVILASSCPYFDKELESGEEEIYLPKSITAAGFEPILEYLYTGNLTIYDDAYSQIKTAAQILEVKSVGVLCDAYSKMTNKNKANVTIKSVGKNDSEKPLGSFSINNEKKSNKEPQTSAETGVSSSDCTKNMIPESLRSSLSVSVTSSVTNPTKPTSQIKRLNSGLEIIPISAPTDPKCAKKDDLKNYPSNVMFDYDDFDDLSESDEEYSEEGYSDYAEEEALLQKMEKAGTIKKLQEQEKDESKQKLVEKTKVTEPS